MAAETILAKAQAALAQILANAPIAPPFDVKNGQSRALGDVGEVLNVVKSVRPPEVTGVQMGLGEDDPIVEWTQTLNIEWAVRDEDDEARGARFEAGILAIEAAVMADISLGGAVRAATIGLPDYVNHVLATAPHTDAVLIPVRVALRGRTLIS